MAAPAFSAEHDLRVGAALRKIFERDPSAAVSLFGLRDLENELLIIGATANISDKRRHVSEDSILDAVETLADDRPFKACATCGTEKFLSQFDRNPDAKDGRRNDCKQCRRRKQLVRRTRRRAEARAAASRASKKSGT